MTRTRKEQIHIKSWPLCPSLKKKTGSVHLAHEELEADDGINDDDEQNEQSDVQEGNHGFNDGVQHHL